MAILKLYKQVISMPVVEKCFQVFPLIGRQEIYTGGECLMDTSVAYGGD